MKLSSSHIVVAAGTVIILVLAFFLYRDITMIGAGGGEKIGVITFKKRVAQRKFARQVVWQEVEANMPVYANDTIRTEDLSEAEIELKDGTRIKLNEESMIILSLKDQGLDINFARGSISADSRGSGGEGVNITAGGVSVALGKGDLNMNKSGEGVDLTVNSGEATVKGADGERTLQQNQKLTATADDLRVFDINIRLVSPERDRLFVTGEDRLPVTFTWEEVKNVTNLFLELDRTPSFKRARTVKVLGTTHAYPLDPGVHYWRIRARNPQTGEMETSESRRFTVTRDAPLRVLSPREDSTITYRDTLPLVRFRWTASELASGYQLRVSQNQDLSSPVIDTTTRYTGMGSDTLTQGTWYWQVEKILPDTVREGEGVAVKSPVITFKILRTLDLPPPEPVHPVQGKSYTRLMADRQPIVFSWKVNREIEKTRLEIARDKEFNRITRQDETDNTLYRLENFSSPGTYYWRLQGVLGDGSRTSSSETYRFSILEENLVLLEPDNNQRFALDGNERRKDILFTWRDVKLEGSFTLVVAQDREFSRVVKSMRLDDFKTRVSDLPPGTYYWRVSFNEEEGESLRSDIRRLYVLNRLNLPVITKPTVDLIDMMGRESLDLGWRQVPGADRYRVAIFRKDAGAAVNIARFEVQKTDLEFRDLAKLSRGNFLVTVQAVDLEGGRVFRESAEAKREFRLTLGKSDKLEKPRLKVPDRLYIEQ
jgi:hypothetical protein